MIWCVEDDPSIRDLELYTLSSTGFSAKGFENGAEMLEALKAEMPELILLDIMLPGQDGVALLKQLRANSRTAQIPVIMATAKGTEFDKVQSLDMGADDYLVKPFGMMELVSRIKAVLRRSANSVQHILRLQNLTVNLDERTVYIGSERVDLTYKEFEILCLFMKHPKMVFTRDQLYEQVWGDSFVGETRTVDMHIRTLRQKLGAYGEKIETVRNVGYRLGGEE